MINIFVKHFSDTNRNCMENFTKPSSRKKPNQIILHVGRNDSILDRTWKDVVISIVNLACSIKDKNSNVSISNIILRNDNKNLNQKDYEVNSYLKELCKEKDIFLIDNTNKIKAPHLDKTLYLKALYKRLYLKVH